MGNISSCTLQQEELARLSAKSVFSQDEVKALWLQFSGITASEGGISREKFQSAMMFKETAMLDRIFRVFDKDEDNFISFEEFVECLSALSSKADQSDKLKLSFQIYDLDGDNMISVSDLTSALASTLRENDIIIERKEIDDIVSHTMDEMCPDVTGKISMSEYEDLVAQRPQMLSRLSLNISGIIREYAVGFE
jgi:serine/threonine-protein phosphatase 2B regulatory subunit